LVISASGGIAYDPCYLLTSTNVVDPLANWIRLATNRFGSDGKVSLTNAIAGGEPERYFRLIEVGSLSVRIAGESEGLSAPLVREDDEEVWVR
jgi:hypothetical protein